MCSGAYLYSVLEMQVALDQMAKENFWESNQHDSRLVKLCSSTNQLK